MSSVLVLADMKEAEQALIRSKAIVPGERVLFDRARVSPESFDEWLKEHWEVINARLPDLDPRIQPTFNTMMRHMFLTGVVAGRKMGG